jgi:molybdopterin-containing oxidoreductase family iron-sulfur binding subunit
MVACKVENNTPEGVFWMDLVRYEEGAYPVTKNWFMARPCNHCDNPPCVAVCPSKPKKTRYRRANGLVATDADSCIGCRYCEKACPYGVNYFHTEDPKKNMYLDWDDKDLAKSTNGASPAYKNPVFDTKIGKEKRKIAGSNHRPKVVDKCTFCVHRVEKGEQPACAEGCPTSAITFGNLDELTSDISKILQSKKSYRFLEKAGTKPKVYYVGGRQPGPNSIEVEKIQKKKA